MSDRRAFHELPFAEQEGRRTYDEVARQHSYNFKGLVADRLKTYGTCFVLDIGCGNSAFGLQLASEFTDATVVTIDLYSDSERSYSRSDDPGNLYFLQADGEQLPLRSQSFDVIVTTWGPASYPFGNKSNEESYITEMARLLKIDGIAFSRPESKLFSFPLDTIIENPSFPLSLKAKALHFKKIKDDGFWVVFDEEPNLARIYGPGYSRGG